MTREVAWSFSTKGVSLLFFLILNIYLARKFGVDGFGLWSLFLSIVTIFFTLSYFGLNASTKKFVAQYNQTKNLKNILSSSFRLRIIISFIFSLIFLSIHKKIAYFLGSEKLDYLFLLSVPLIFLSGIIDYFKNVFTGLLKIKYNFVVNFTEYGLKLFLVVLFANSIVAVLNFYILALFIASFFGFYFIYFCFYKNLKTSNKNFSKEILNYSYPLFFITFGFLALTEIDIVMIGLFSTTREVGVYSVAKQIISKLPHISLAIVMGTMPVFAKINYKNKKNLKFLFDKIIMINFLVFLAIVLGILTLAPFFIPLLFGDQFLGSVLPLRILTFYLLAFSISIILNNFLDYTGRARKRATNISITIILNIFLNFILIPRYGAVGAAISTSVSYLPYVILNWFEVKKIFRSI